ncbi:MAG: hypothetical protein WBP85_16000 [Terracidiphilus sp.]
MSLIPMMVFCLVVLAALAGRFAKKGRAVSSDELATLLAPVANLLPDALSLAHAAPACAAPRTKKSKADEMLKVLKVLIPLVMRVTLTVVFTAAGFWFLFSHSSSDEEKRWASAILGTVLGYWLK